MSIHAALGNQPKTRIVAIRVTGSNLPKTPPAYEEKDTCMSNAEEDTDMSYEEEDTCMSYEEEDTYLSKNPPAARLPL